MLSRRKLTVWWVLTTVPIGLFCSVQALAKRPERPPANEDPSGFSSVHLTLTASSGAEYARGVAWDIDDADPEMNQRAIVGAVWTEESTMQAAYWDVSPAGDSLRSTLCLLSDGCVATSINQAGEIVGCGIVEDQDVGLYWKHPLLSPLKLSPLPGHTTSEARAINQDGVICGISRNESGFDAVVWRVHEVDSELVVHGPMSLRTVPPSGDPYVMTGATDLNDNVEGTTQVVGIGHRFIDGGDFRVHEAVTWEVVAHPDGSLSVVAGPRSVDFGDYSSATGIDLLGAICGYSGDHALVTSGSAVDQLPEPSNGSGCFVAEDVNDAGEVIGDGVVLIRKGKTQLHAFIWRLNEGNWSVIDLDGYLPREVRGNSRALAINNAGEVVGDAAYAPFLLVPK